MLQKFFSISRDPGARKMARNQTYATRIPSRIPERPPAKRTCALVVYAFASALQYPGLVWTVIPTHIGFHSIPGSFSMVENGNMCFLSQLRWDPQA